MKKEPYIIDGGLAVDDRGEIVFVNGFNFDSVKRFYAVSNHKAGFLRAWHAHKKEAKYVIALSGTALVGTVEIDDWEKPSVNLKAGRYILSARKPQILYIPAGYANGFMSLTPDLKLIFFSTSTLEESSNDDFRYDSRYWDIWNVTER
ncbi:MAG: dTDP-4-dehydrorhamnose 3,5-epimerase family protein [Sedimentisphaerales bacterium]|nr:dTDP-4-dehydrorhamnose 3,5-epimerase family protein [Sedimentisphaerales bacterium]